MMSFYHANVIITCHDVITLCLHNYVMMSLCYANVINFVKMSLHYANVSALHYDVTILG